MMYNWLLKTDDYQPQKDKDFFIDQSALSIISKLTGIRKENRESKSFFYSLNSILKFITTILLILTLSFLRDFLSISSVFAYVVLSLALINISDIKKIMAISFFTVLFSFIILLPSALMGNVANAVIICTKVLSTVIIINIFAYTTKNQDITGAVKIFRTPDFFILIMDITIRHIVIIGEMAVNMLYSLKTKSVGKNRNKIKSMYNILGFLFMKSKRFSEDVYASMLCRGFSGKYKSNRSIYGLHLFDYLYALINIAVITGVFIWGN